MPLEWRDGLAIGHAAIDADHMHLIEIINRFEESPDLAHAEQAARDLLAHARGHFSREEKIQKASGYPLCTLHRIQHEQLLAQLKVLIRLYFIDRISDSVEEVVEEMRHLIRQWFIGHVIEMDLKMRAYVGDEVAEVQQVG